MNAVYDQSPRNFVVGVVFFGPTSQLSNPVVSPKQFKYAIKTNHTTYLNNDYFKSRFLTAQVLIRTIFEPRFTQNTRTNSLFYFTTAIGLR